MNQSGPTRHGDPGRPTPTPRPGTRPFLETINYDLPNAPESCVHRIGRPARAGRSGVAISFCDAEERAYLRDIETLIRTGSRW